jgi:hypothetical protein
MFSDKNDLNSHGGLMNEYGKLQIQLKQLKILEKRMLKQLDELRQEESKMLHDIQRFNNLDALRSEYASKYEELSTAVEEMKDKKRVTENVVRDSERRNQTIKVSAALKSPPRLSINDIIVSGIVEEQRNLPTNFAHGGETQRLGEG